MNQLRNDDVVPAVVPGISPVTVASLPAAGVVDEGGPAGVPSVSVAGLSAADRGRGRKRKLF